MEEGAEAVGTVSHMSVPSESNSEVVEVVQDQGDELTREERFNKIKAQWLAGRGSMRELAERWGIAVETVHGRAHREQWGKLHEELQRKVTQKAESWLSQQATAWIKETLRTTQLLHTDILACRDQIGPAIDPDALSALALTLERINKTARLNLGMSSENKAIDVTSGGLPIQSAVMATLKHVGALKDAGQLDTSAINVDALVNEPIDTGDGRDEPTSGSSHSDVREAS